MKALCLEAPGRFGFRDMPQPNVPAGWVSVRMRYIGICGSDIHYFEAGRIGDQIVRYPFILGHEGSGQILDGAGLQAPGTPVYIEPAMVCHRCDQCLAGRENTCRNLKFLGNPLESDGCLREEIAMPSECAVPIPAWMGLDEAVLLEPLSIAVYSVLRSRAVRGCSAAVVGAGPIGLSVLVALSALPPAATFVSEPVAERRRAAEKLGAELTFDPGDAGAAASLLEASGGGADVVFECCGTQEAIDDAWQMLRPGGTLVLVGIPQGAERISYDPHLARRREIEVVNIRRQNRCVERALFLLESRRDAASVLITHRFPAAQAQKGFELVQQRAEGVVKALVTF